MFVCFSRKGRRLSPSAFTNVRVFDGKSTRQSAQLAKMTRWYFPANVLRTATSTNASLLAMSGPVIIEMYGWQGRCLAEIRPRLYKHVGLKIRNRAVTCPRKIMHARAFSRGTWLSAALIAGGIVSACPSGAYAQISPFRGYKGPTLSKEDLASGQAAANKLLTEDQAEVGKSEDWAGPTSGNMGTISIQRAYQRQGLECRALRSEVRYKKASTASPRVLNLNVCRTKTNEWKLM